MNMKVGYITIPVSDVKEAVSFYEKLFGTKKLFESENQVIFDCNGVEMALVTGGHKGKQNSKKSIYFIVDDIEKAYDELKAKGVEFEGAPENADWGGRIACFTDPDGNRYGVYKMIEKA